MRALDELLQRWNYFVAKDEKTGARRSKPGAADELATASRRGRRGWGEAEAEMIGGRP